MRVLMFCLTSLGGLSALASAAGPVAACKRPLADSSINATIKANGLPILCPGGSVLLYYASTINDRTFQWQFNGTDIDGATFQTYQATQPGSYTLRIRWGTVSTTSQPLVVQVGSLPKPVLRVIESINAVPDPCDGSRFIMSDYSGYYQFQWYRNGQPISQSSERISVFYGNSGTGFYTLVSQSGAYTLGITSGGCSVISDPLNFDKEARKNTLPVELFDYSVGACAGSSPSLYLPEYYSADKYEVDWQKDGQFVQSSTYTGLFVPTEGLYSVQVKSKQKGCTGTASARVRFTGDFKVTPDYPTGNQTLCRGSSFTLSASYSARPDRVQLLKNGQPVPDANPSFYQITEPGQYAIQARSGSCTVTSEPVNLRFVDPSTPIISQKSSATCQGTVSLAVAQPVEGVSYSWRRNGRSIVGSESIAFQPTSSGSYSVVARREGCGSESVPVAVTANAPIAAPPLTPVGYSPTDPLTTCLNPVRISYTPRANQTYQWLKDNAPLNVTTPEIIVAEYEQSGTYTLVTTENGCSVNQSVSVRTFGKLFKPLVKAPAGLAVCPGQFIKLFVDDPRLTNRISSLQWLRDGGEVLGATAPQLDVVESGRYVAQVTPLGCSLKFPSEPLTVAKSNLPVARITADKKVFCSDAPARLQTAPVIGVRYRWLRDDQPLPNDTLNVLSANQSGSYALETSDALGCRLRTDTLRLTVFAAATAAIGGSAFVPYDSTATLSIAVGGHAPIDLTLSDGTQFTGLSPTTLRYPVRLKQTTTFTVREVKNRCGVGKGTGAAEMKVIILGTEPVADLRMSAQPVPTTARCEVRVTLPAPADAEATLLDPGGRVLHRQVSPAGRSAEHTFGFDLTTLPSGTYLVRVRSGETVLVRRVRKE